MSAAAAGTKNVREVRELQFKDGSLYAGQVLEGYSATLPYGYGQMKTKEGFTVQGQFKEGKSQGWGVFSAPNGDLFYGNWNRNHKRCGKGVSIRASDGTVCVEEYDENEGKLLKKVKRRPPAANTLHWLPPLGLPGTDPRHTWTGTVPPGHAGHSATLTADGSLLLVFGGEVRSGAGTALSNELYMLDVASRVWVKPATSGTVPPPMSGHTATLWNNKLVIIGGQLGGIEASSSVFLFDLASGSWSCPVSKGLPLVNHTASLVGKNEIWVLQASSVFVLSLSSWEWREVDVANKHLPRHIPRSFINASAVTVGNMIYVFGGKWLGLNPGEGKKYERLSGDLRILHTDKLMWEAPTCTGPAAAGAAQGTADYTGFVRGAWDVPRAEHTATLVGDRMYVIGGWTTSNPAMNVVDTCYLNDVQSLHVETLQWDTMPALPIFIHPRSLHSCVALAKDHEIWCYGGRNSAHVALNDWNILHLPSAPAGAAPSAQAAAAAPATKKPAAAAKPAVAAGASAAPASVAVPTADVAAMSLRDEPPPLPAEPEAELLDAQSAGSGSILDAFTSQFSQQDDS